MNELTSNLLTVCPNSSWGELTMSVKGINVCFVHYDGLDYIEYVESNAPSTLVQKFHHILLFFLLWHLLFRGKADES